MISFLILDGIPDLRTEKDVDFWELKIQQSLAFENAYLPYIRLHFV